MAYQTNSGNFFDYLTQLLIENKVSETIQILSDASSSDPTLNGDLKFLKLRANKKLMVPAGGVGGPPKTQIQDVIKLIKELKSAHYRREVKVNTLTEPSKKAMKQIRKNNPSSDTSSKKKRSIWPWIFFLLLLGGCAAGYYFKDQILQSELVKEYIPEGFLSSNDASEINKASAVVPKIEKKQPKKETTASSTPSSSSTLPSSSSSSSSLIPVKPSSSNKKVIKPSSTSNGRYFIQIASYSELKQAKDKRKRVEMSFDRAIILQKDLGGKPNYKIVIPGFETRENAEDFQDDRKVDRLYIGAFIQPFRSGCGKLTKLEENVYVCK
ncbi:MAG: SPOR domain-containing protein [Saprospiraceae bacterium]